MMTWRMIIKKIGGNTALAALCATVVFGSIATWPLAKYSFSGISASHRPEVGGAREMIEGDHLQLLYTFQLTDDFIRGGTPWFYDLYEFNEGDDAARYKLDFYYMPFSLIYSFGARIAGPAFGWNLTGLISLWLMMWGMLLLVRRYTPDRAAQLTIAIITSLFPYRLITFLHGSPTGFGIAYVPFFLLGLDWAIRDGRIRGGILAGLVFLLSGWVDTHTFLFLGLLAPFWCLWVYLYTGSELCRQRVKTIIRGIFPFVLLCILVALQIWFVRRLLQKSSMVGGRTIQDVRLFSPIWQAFLLRGANHADSYIYFTWTLLICVVAGLGILIHTLLWAPARQRRLQALLLVVLCLGAGGVLMLALGPNMPIHAADVWWERLCRIVPPYGMIRQPAKVLVLVPSLLAVFLAGAYAQLRGKRPVVRHAVCGALVIMMCLEVSGRIDPSICLLDREQGAYQAIVDDARKQKIVPRAMAVVLWPGDTHWSSLYQYYGMKYRIRMLNGYIPHVARRYIDEVFYRYESMNRGHATDEQLDALLAADIKYLVLHEDAFPERVSPFGVAQTLQGFLTHPRIRFLAQDRAVWAFEIMAEPDDSNVIDVPWNVASVSYCWDAERIANGGAVILEDRDCQGGAFARLADPTHMLQIPNRGIQYVDTLRLSARVRGHGVLRGEMVVDGGEFSGTHEISTDDWKWLDLPYLPFTGFHADLQYNLTVPQGKIDVDYVYVAQGAVPDNLAVGGTFEIAAPLFFRAGYTDLANHALVLRPELVSAGTVLYGPRLPFPAGRYRIRMHYRSDADLTLGVLSLNLHGNEGKPHKVVVQGAQRTAVIDFEQRLNLPVTLQFDYNRTASMVIEKIVFERIE